MSKTTSNSANTAVVPILILVSITLLCLVPFAGRAFNIDEPLFIWVAKQIQLHPLDFYGFRINWYGTEMGAANIIKNPPLASYYIALVAAVTGWKEIPLHLAFLLPAIAAVLGTYFLAREFTGNPLPATLIAILNPVFILSSATVMCDTMMLAFYVWAVFFWVRGIKNDRHGDLLLSAFLIALCSLTKYFGVSLIPLLFLYTLLSEPGKRKRVLYLLIPVLILCLYQWQTNLLYGKGLLSDAASYANKERGINVSGILAGLATGLSFTGGCFITAGFFAGRLLNRRILLAAALVVPCAALALSFLKLPHVGLNPSWGYFLQLALFIFAGIGLLFIAGLDFWQRKDRDALLLALWVLGTFLFAAVVNWSVNGRSILPMAPAAAIVVMRFMERRNGNGWLPGLKEIGVPLSLAFVLSMAVTWADYRLADTARSAAAVIATSYPSSAKPVWFQGHWGFQYYMAKNGAAAYDRKNSSIQPADVMVVPENNTNAFPDIFAQGDPLQVLTFSPASFLSTMNYSAGAGYYSDSFGALPFLVGTELKELYHIITFRRAVSVS